MSPHDFLAAVLPPPGYGLYCAAGYKGAGHRHVFTEEIEGVVKLTADWSEEQRDAYFGVATFDHKVAHLQKDRRTAANARHIRLLALDLDGYASKRDAADALGAFLVNTGLEEFGTPWIVGSGGGLHCYWAFTQILTIAEWHPVAEAFKLLCKQEALVIDNGITADAARVLRVPNTFNYKRKYTTPRPVKLLVVPDIPQINFTAFAERVKARSNSPIIDTSVAIQLPGQRPTQAVAGAGVKLLENSAHSFKDILARTTAGDGCMQLQYYAEHAQDDGMEPLWRALLSQAKYCIDAEKGTKWLSRLHPYDEQRTAIKLREIKGPYPCSKIESENPGVCSKCKYYGKITNLLALGRNVQVDTSTKEIEIKPSDPEDPDAPAITVVRPTPPKGYAYGVNGGVFMDKTIEEADGMKRKQQIMLLPYELFVTDILNKEGEHTVHMIANRPGKPVDVLVPQRSIIARDDMLKALAQQNILSSFGSGNDKNLFDYVRACVEEASTSKTPVRIPQQYGWQEDETFVYNGRVYFNDGRTRTVPMPDLTNLTRVTRPLGTLDGWRQFVYMFVQKGLWEHLAIASTAFGAPLMRYTQMSALTFHAGSTASGTGKSLALSLASSVWGHPIRYRTGKSTSPVTMQQRMGNLNSLLFTSDEITHKSRQDMEWFPGFVFDAAEGQGKEKSEVHNNRERINNVSWSTLLLLTSNTNMHDYMSGARQHSSQGELLRMLEWTPETVLEWTAYEEEQLKLLQNNYGVAGEKYVYWLVKHQHVARKILSETITFIKKEWKMSGDERYWAAGCGATIAGAVLAGNKYADIVDLPIEHLIAALKVMVERARRVVRTGARTAEDILNNFIRDNYGQFVVVKMNHTSNELEAKMGDGLSIDQSITRGKVMGRVEHSLTKIGHTELYIEEAVMKTYCVAMSFGYDTFRKQIELLTKARAPFVRKDMMAKTKGPTMRVRAINIVREDWSEGEDLGVENAAT